MELSKTRNAYGADDNPYKTDALAIMYAADEKGDKTAGEEAKKVAYMSPEEFAKIEKADDVLYVGKDGKVRIEANPELKGVKYWQEQKKKDLKFSPIDHELLKEAQSNPDVLESTLTKLYNKIILSQDEYLSDLSIPSLALSSFDYLNHKIVSSIPLDIISTPSKNYKHNQEIDLSETGALSGNYINKQSKLGEYNFGLVNINWGGCGVIAMYNVLQGLGQPKEFADLIYENEDAALLKGIIGTSPSSIKHSLRSEGFMVTNDYNVDENLNISDNDAVIHLYFRSDFTAHYVAGISNGDGTFQFYNSDTGITTPMTWEEYYTSTSALNKKSGRNILYSCTYNIKKE